MILAGIRLYRRFLSPMLPAACRFVPSCSAYAEEAFLKHGQLKGAKLAIDHEANDRFYASAQGGGRALASPTGTEPSSAQQFLQVVTPITAGLAAPRQAAEVPAEEAVTFPLE